MAFKDRLREAREKAGLDQIELANKLNVRNSTISNYETGKSFPKIDIFCKIVEVLNTSPNFLYQDEVDIEGILERQKQKTNLMENKLLTLYRSVSEEGQDRILNYADDIASSGKYKKDNQHKLVEKTS